MIKTLLLKGRSLFAIVFFFFFSHTISAQLTPFTLEVTAVTESCTANGTLNFNATNTTAGATVIYRIFHLPDTTTPIAVLSTNTFTGLVAGNYRVIATQSLGNLSNMQQQDAVITNTIDPLDYYIQSSAEVCGDDGKITIQVTEGNAVSYEIFSGPVIRPLQASNIFDNLPGGTYLIRVFDNCGEGVARSYTLSSYNSLIVIGNGNLYLSGCNNFSLSPQIFPGSGSMIAHPVTAVVTVYPPTGAPLVFNNLNTITIPAIFTQPYTYSVSVTNACGETYTRNNIPIVMDLDPQVYWNLVAVGCSGKRLSFSVQDMTSPITFTFNSAPAGFNPLTYNPNYPLGGSFYNPNIPFPNGSYTVTATDSCGHTDTITFSISEAPHIPGEIHWTNRPGCQPGFGSLWIYGDDSIESITLLSAPAAYTQQTLPHDFTGQMNQETFYFGVVPAGNYVFKTVDSCGSEVITTIPVIGYSVGATNVTITENCASFNLYLQHTTTAYSTYCLQKWNTVTGQWGHPVTGNAGTPGVYNYQNSYYLSGGNNNNLEFSGSFRIVKVWKPYYMENANGPGCVSVIYSFEYTSGPKIIDVYSFVCENNTYDALVIAHGYDPLTYRITTKNGQPFFINNGSSNIFLGLQPAIYSFQIEDGCGNILNSLFDISNPSTLDITASEFCPGQNASLTVPVFPFLSYQWWKGNDTANILSTANELEFPAFNPTISNGMYHVRIYYEGNPNSCIDFVSNYQIAANPNLPNAGEGQSVTYCGSQGTVNLFSLLTGAYDTGGTWQETTSSGTLTDNLWNSDDVVPGNYHFNYSVTGACNASDQSTVNIQIKAMPETPVAFLEQPICAAGDLYLLATQIPFGTYQWSGPNGFTSNLQNPIINNLSALNNGTYTVKSLANGCESGESSIAVTVNPLPDVKIEGGCANDRYMIRAVPVENSFNPENVSYAWTGPENFTSTENPIDVTRKKGIYIVTVTAPEGCSVVAETHVLNPICTVPAGISPNDDGLNENLDLTGFDVIRFKIFNRYGRMVFEQDNYTNQWHGQDFNGNALADATYYYYIRFGNGEEKTGWVYVTK